MFQVFQRKVVFSSFLKPFKFFPFYLSLFLVSFLSCQQKETRVISLSMLLDQKSQNEDPLVNFSFKENDVMVDARSVFEYKVSHFKGSIQVNWRNFFNWKEENGFLKVKSNLDLQIKKLTRLGIHPQSLVLIYGNGKKGGGEEWALAWVFLYLDFKNVKIVSLNEIKKRGLFVNQSFDFRTSIKESKEEKVESKKSLKFWDPVYKKNLIADQKEIRSFLRKDSFFLKEKKLDQKILRFWFVDLSRGKFFERKRETEGKAKGKTKGKVSIRDFQKKVLRWDWKDFLFFGDKSSKRLKRKLLKKGLQTEDRIFVLGKKQEKVLAVTASLYLMGFKNVASYFDQGGEIF